MIDIRLRECRIERGWTLEYVHKKTGVGKSTLSEIENGKHMPSMETLDLLLQLFEIKMESKLVTLGA